MVTVKRIPLWQINSLCKIAKLLVDCGNDMKAKYGLIHWKNSFLKTFLITIYTVIRNRGTLFAVLESESLIATYQLYQRGLSMHFCKLAVSPQNSGGGIGSFCINQMEITAQRQGCKNLSCEVYKKSSHALNFYLNRGFKIVGNVRTLKFDEFKLEKQLNLPHETINA